MPKQQTSRRIVGFQVHHSTGLGDAAAAVAVARAKFASLGERMGDDEMIELARALEEPARKASALTTKARERMQKLYEDDPERFKRCRDGAEPWPDEPAEGFVPRCTCNDVCRQHFELEVDGNGQPYPGEPLDPGAVILAQAEGWVCNCEPCPAHPLPVPEHPKGEGDGDG